VRSLSRRWSCETKGDEPLLHQEGGNAESLLEQLQRPHSRMILVSRDLQSESFVCVKTFISILSCLFLEASEIGGADIEVGEESL
jgi:hypothetical protein